MEKKDMVDQKKELEIKANQGDIKAQYELGKLERNNGNNDNAKKWLKRAAVKGKDGDSFFELALIYDKEEKHELENLCLEMALECEIFNTLSFVYENLGYNYLYGIGYKQDCNEAAYYLDLAKLLNNSMAFIHYINIWIKQKNWNRAIELLNDLLDKNFSHESNLRAYL